VLAEEGAGEVTGYRVGFVLVLGLVGYEAAGIVVIRKNDAFSGGIKTDTELSATLSTKASRAESLDLSRECDG
jgi:hypothetical protein